ncbi:MAG TPA: CotH kinase family protein [Saprospiraceae bacterium]|nr:CotH kinase family protein [Saprospiraceae bacterium]
MKKISSLLLVLAFIRMDAQKLPEEMEISANGQRLISGGKPVTGLYRTDQIRRVELVFSQPDYWTQLTNNYQSKKDIPATLIMDGESYPNVGVRFKGQTSYQRVTTQKKSFNVTMDFMDTSQDLKGYETLNFNNSFEDNSYIREVLYENITRPFFPSLKAGYIHLYINGQDWGLYPNVQALDGEYVKQWFLSNEGSRWRCERQAGTGGPGGGGFGAGTSTLNYLGEDTALYKPNYTLKNTTLENPWSDLVRVTRILNTVPLNQHEDSLNKVLDVDRALWFLAKEILFGDDDSYINKGGMDYYAIYQKDVERLIPLEYDANSVMKGQTATWSIFLKEADVRFPLANRLFAVPALRQRYLAHFRTLFNQTLDSSYFKSQVDYYYQLIDSVVVTDPKKLMTYQAFNTEKNVLINWMRNRRTFVLNNTEFKQVPSVISEVSHSVDGMAFKTPTESQTVEVTARIQHASGVRKANLYYASGFDGYFNKTELLDDGNHQDGAAGDGVFGASIPAFPNGVYVRYYIEAIANNSAGTASYMPEGAEHDVYTYQVDLQVSGNLNIAINELMASNTKTVADQDGEFDDWIELYNKSTQSIDISQWILTDNPANLDKYRFPYGTVIPANGYLIVWADENGKQTGYHANFKLSASGEEVILLDSLGNQVDKVVFGQQTSDLSYARRPNGTGAFVIQDATFNKNNDPVTTDERLANQAILVYPNPAGDYLTIKLPTDTEESYQLIDAVGKLHRQGRIDREQTLDLSDLSAGMYFIRIRNQSIRFLLK